jgi:hypothetical protein
MALVNHEELLYKIFNNVNEWLKFAEAKNFGLLTLNAAVVFGFTKINFTDGNVIAKAGIYVFCPLAAFSFLAALISLFPILSNIEKGSYAKSWINGFCNWLDEEKKFENIHFYGYLKHIDEKEFEVEFLNKISSTKAFTQFEKELVTQILYNSRITWLKYQLFKIGAFFFMLGIIVFIFALPILKYCM